MTNPLWKGRAIKAEAEVNRLRGELSRLSGPVLDCVACLECAGSGLVDGNGVALRCNACLAWIDVEDFAKCPRCGAPPQGG